jgi:UDP-glucose 4-epimerase
MARLVVSGVSGTIGRRLIDALEREGGGEVVVGIDRLPPRQRPDWLDARIVDLVEDDVDALLDDALADADVLVHLAFEGDPRLPVAQLERANVDGTRRLLDAAARAGVHHVVYVSSATVYGAWADNPVPLDETTPLRPNPGYAPAVHKAEAERLLADWRDEHPGVGVAILRPVFVVGPGSGDALSALVHRGVAPAKGGALPPRQFLHEDDAASAVLVAVRERLVGVFNVAPDGWEGPLPAGGYSRRRRTRRAGRAVHPAMLPLGRDPWVVSNARLRAAGWAPRHSTVDAVAACPPVPAPRAEITALVLGAGVVAGVVLGRRRRS